MRLELTSGLAATCFQDRLLIRPDDFRSFISCFSTALRTAHARVPCSVASRYRRDMRPTKKPDVFVTPGFGSQQT